MVDDDSDDEEEEASLAVGKKLSPNSSMEVQVPPSLGIFTAQEVAEPEAPPPANIEKPRQYERTYTVTEQQRRTTTDADGCIVTEYVPVTVTKTEMVTESKRIQKQSSGGENEPNKKFKKNAGPMKQGSLMNFFGKK